MALGWAGTWWGKSEEKDWYEAVGSWIVDTVKWPGKTLLESNEACHKQGMKVLTWFESEGVGDLDDMVRYHGFKPEWGSYYKWNRYTLTNEDTGEVRSLSGSALASEGLSLVLDEAKTSAVWHILPE